MFAWCVPNQGTSYGPIIMVTTLCTLLRKADMPDHYAHQIWKCSSWDSVYKYDPAQLHSVPVTCKDANYITIMAHLKEKRP